MSRLRRILLARHGETDGESSVRFHGSADVELSSEGREQMGRLARQLRHQTFDLVVASPLRRSWRAAWIVGGGVPVRLESDFREVDFGRWEGLTAEEIQAQDPILYEDWQSGSAGFDYPGGEARDAFRARICRGLDRLLASQTRCALLVIHKGVIRVIVEQLTGRALPAGEPPLGGLVTLTRSAEGGWFLGQHSSNPPGLDQQAA